MGLFDEVKGMALQAAEGEVQSLLGGAVQNAVPGGLGGLLSTLQQGGLGAQVQSWLGDGHNLPISADQLQSVLGDQHVQQIAQQLGLNPQDVLQHLATHLPGLASQQATDQPNQ